MTTATIDRTETLEARQLSVMNYAFAAAPFHQHYLTRVVSQPLTLEGLAMRVQEAFGLGELYDKRYTPDDGKFLVFLLDMSIPSDLVRQALQTVALDRVVAESIRAESALAADRHLGGDPVCRQLDYIPRGCRTRDVQAAYIEILNEILQTPGYRDQVGAEFTELF